ncbi:LysR family transcriptional regulator [Candidatus Sodalis pierantonius]|uniref:LysR family transcriptional regulator n=1 Tax=Candidatus Sodalis pierantonii TaxID=1486991 RepID=UPI0009005164
MRLRHIEIIHAIMASGSISGAARRLNVSQPNISRCWPMPNSSWDLPYSIAGPPGYSRRRGHNG